MPRRVSSANLKSFFHPGPRALSTASQLVSLLHSCPVTICVSQQRQRPFSGIRSCDSPAELLPMDFHHSWNKIPVPAPAHKALYQPASEPPSFLQLLTHPPLTHPGLSAPASLLTIKRIKHIPNSTFSWFLCCFFFLLVVKNSLM